MRRPIVAVLALGCGPALAIPSGGAQTSGHGTDASSSTTTSTSSSTQPEQDETSERTGTSGSGGPTDVVETSGSNDWPPGFIGSFDNLAPELECDVWAQDCPPGEKCVPWASDGGISWNATRCVVVVADPDQPGDACIVEGSGAALIDTCDVGSICWDVDPDTDEGTCIAQCLGNENNPICSDPQTTCSITSESVLNLCLPICDPLAQDCANGDVCIGMNADFVCAPDASGENGAFGDPCEFVNVCNVGLACVAPDLVYGCPHAGCCSPFCHLGVDENCPGEGQLCLPWFEPDEVLPEYENVGVCGVPE